MGKAEQIKSKFASEMQGMVQGGKVGPALHVAPSRAAQFEGVTRLRSLAEVSIDKIYAEEQPRETFDEEAIAELAESIRRYGLLQPVTLNPWSEERQGYQLRTGERRFRACKLFGLKSIRAEVKDQEPTQAELYAKQLVENLHRQDLSEMEEAKGYKSLMELEGLTVTAVAERLKVSKSKVSKAIACLEKLSPVVQEAVERGSLTISNAYELTKLEEPSRQEEILTEVIQSGLTQEETAERVKEERKAKPSPAAKASSASSGKKKPGGVKVPERLVADNGIVIQVAKIKKNQGLSDLAFALRNAADKVEDVARKTAA